MPTAVSAATARARAARRDSGRGRDFTVRKIAGEHVAQQPNSRIRSHLVVAQQDGKLRLGVENTGEPEQLVLHLVDLTGLLGANQQGLACCQLDCVDKIGFGRPAFGDCGFEDIESGLTHLARHKPLDQLDSRR